MQYLVQDAAFEKWAESGSIWFCRLRELPEFAGTRCVAIACPAVMTKDLASSCAGYVTSIINDTDMVPTMSLGERPSTPVLDSVAALV